MIILILFSVTVLRFCRGVPPSPTDSLMNDVRQIKEKLDVLVSNDQKTNERFLEDMINQLQYTLTSVDINVKHLQERAHVWDTFQLHVSAWNDQLSTVDRKLDILSKAQEKLDHLDTKLNAIAELEFKLNRIVDTVAAVEGQLQKNNAKFDQVRDQDLFGEYGAGGILKQLLEKNGKCHAEDILRDISSKVDVIFDKICEKDDGSEDGYFENEGSGEIDERKRDFDIKLLRDVLKRFYEPSKKSRKALEKVLMKIEDITKDTSGISNIDYKINELQKILNEKLDEQNKTIQIMLRTYKMKTQIEPKVVSYNDIFTTSTVTDEKVPTTERILTDLPYTGAFDYTFCYFTKLSSGIISFQKPILNEAARDYNTRVCERGWTVIQRRGDHFNRGSLQGERFNRENFNRSWYEYKMGFGEFTQDFWFGNDFLHKLTFENDLMLRIELENFDGIKVWAEYDVFKVKNESELYEIEIGGYNGTASDSFSSHNRSKFSTYDVKNDDAPACCPCAVSYGSGWWFNSCFESNLNGPYYDKPQTGDYYKGIIWEHWLGNYSLKKTKMMVKPKGSLRPLEDMVSIPIFIEDP